MPFNPNRTMFRTKPNWDQLEMARVKTEPRFQQLKARHDCKTCKFLMDNYPGGSPCIFCSSDKKEEYEPMAFGDHPFDYLH